MTVDFQKLVSRELVAARDAHPAMHSLHEAYAVMLEELDEFWEQVKMKARFRSKMKMRHELIQVAAMAQRTAEDLGLLE